MKRYVFWRSPNGKPYCGNDDRFALPLILEEVGKKAAGFGRNMGWMRLIPHYETCLRPSLIVIGPDEEELNDADSWDIAREGLIAVLKGDGVGKPVSSTAFLREADKKAAEFFRKTPDNYIVVSSLSVEQMPAKQISLPQSKVKALASRGQRFPYPETVQNTFPLVTKRGRKDKPIAIEVRGRSTHEAVNRALSDLSLLRGLWTLFGKYGSWSINLSSPSTQKPLGAIHSGPIHTLHHPDGAPVGGLFWYEPEYLDGPFDQFTPSKGWAGIEKRRRWAIRRLKVLPYRQDLKEILVRFAEALDQCNLDVAFIHLWGILEKLTDTVGANYDETVRRAVWAYDDRKFAAEMLGAMRLHRNRLVHAAHAANQRDQVAYIVKSFVEPHLLRLLRNDFDVSSFEEYGKQLSTSTNVETLKKQRRALGRTIRFLGNKKKSSSDTQHIVAEVDRRLSETIPPVTAKFMEFVTKAELAMPPSRVSTATPQLSDNFQSFVTMAEQILQYSNSGMGLSKSFQLFIDGALPQVFSDIKRVLPEIAKRANLAARWLVNDDLLAVAGCRFVEDAYTELMAWALSPDTHPPSAQRRQSAWLASLGLGLEIYLTETCVPRTQVHTEDGIPDLVMSYVGTTVAVEAKTGTNEHLAPSGEMQTLAYVESLRKALDLSPELPLKMVFLTTDGREAANKEAICTTYVEFVLAVAAALDGVELPADTRAAFAILFTHLLTCATNINIDVHRMVREIQTWSQQRDWCEYRNIIQRCNTLLEAIDYFKPERTI